MAQQLLHVTYDTDDSQVQRLYNLQQLYYDTMRLYDDILEYYDQFQKPALEAEATQED